MTPLWIAYILVAFLAASAYGLLQAKVRRSACLEKTRTQEIIEESPPPSLTVIVAARNEAHRITPLIQAMQQQTYPADRWQWLIVDDHSDDGTAAIVRPYLRKQDDLLTLSPGQTGKKAAISYAVSRASGALLVFTDADTQPGPRWLECIAQEYQRRPFKALSGAVRLTGKPSVLGRLQQLDMAATMLLTRAADHAGWFQLANGANLTVLKQAFIGINGYENDNLVSGDDVLLVQRLEKRNQGSVRFSGCPDLLVNTSVESSWPAFWQQRLRWAGKTTHYPQQSLIVLWAGLFVWHLLLWFSIALLIIFPATWPIACTLWATKFSTDYLSLRLAVQQFSTPAIMRWWGLTWLIHSMYIVMVGIVALIRPSFTWKGRKS